MTAPLQTTEDAVHWCTAQFSQHDLYYGHGTDNPADEAYFLVWTLCDLLFSGEPELFARRLTAVQLERIRTVTAQRIATRQPLAYLLNIAWFAGYEFYVNEHVLVPRSPIAELIGTAYQPWVDPAQVRHVLEIGTGSGCIAIASALALPDAQVDAVDISPEALAVAQRNVEHYELQARVTLHQADVFAGLPQKPYDLIVSNPPYVDAADIAAMPAEFQAEPILGLQAGDDGLDIVRRILAAAPDYLAENGVLIVEVGNSAPALEAAFPDVPFTWLDFDYGGQGVFLLNRQDL